MINEIISVPFRLKEEKKRKTKKLSIIQEWPISDQQSVPEVYYSESERASELEACPLLWRTVIKKACAQRSSGPKGAIGIQETTQALLRGNAALARGRVGQTDGVSYVTAGSWYNVRVLHNVCDPSCYLSCRRGTGAFTNVVIHKD